MSLRLQVGVGTPGWSRKYTSPSTEAVPDDDHLSAGRTILGETCTDLSIVLYTPTMDFIVN